MEDYFRRPKVNMGLPKPISSTPDPIDILEQVYAGVAWDDINEDASFITLAVLSGEICAFCGIKYALKAPDTCPNVRHLNLTPQAER